MKAVAMILAGGATYIAATLVLDFAYGVPLEHWWARPIAAAMFALSASLMVVAFIECEK